MDFIGIILEKETNKCIQIVKLEMDSEIEAIARLNSLVSDKEFFNLVNLKENTIFDSEYILKDNTIEILKPIIGIRKERRDLPLVKDIIIENDHQDIITNEQILKIIELTGFGEKELPSKIIIGGDQQDIESEIKFYSNYNFVNDFCKTSYGIFLTSIPKYHKQLTTIYLLLYSIILCKRYKCDLTDEEFDRTVKDRCEYNDSLILQNEDDNNKEFVKISMNNNLHKINEILNIDKDITWKISEDGFLDF